MNNNLLKKSKLKNIFIKISQKEKLKHLQSYFTKWQKVEKEKIVINNNSLNQNEIKKEIIDNNKFYISNNNNVKEIEKGNEIKNNNIFKEIKNIENGANKYKQVLEFDENIFPPYEENNNNSINNNN